MSDPEKETIEQREWPDHLARHVQEQHHSHLVGFIGRIMQERVVEQYSLSLMPEIFFALFDGHAIAIA